MRKGQTDWKMGAVIGATAILIIAAMGALIHFKGQAGSAALAAVNPDLSGQTDWVKGKPDAPLVLVEYSDFQCPACALYEPILQRLEQELGDQLVVVYRYFPLTQIHKNAKISAQAAEAAGQQGKFWDMHDTLFAHQTEWEVLDDPQDTFKQYAQDFGLNTDQFMQDLQATKTVDRVNRDLNSGLNLGVNSTPSFFVNDKKGVGYGSYDEFKQFVLDQLPVTQ